MYSPLFVYRNAQAVAGLSSQGVQGLAGYCFTCCQNAAPLSLQLVSMNHPPSNPTRPGGSKKQRCSVDTQDLWSQQHFCPWLQHGQVFIYQPNQVEGTGVNSNDLPMPATFFEHHLLSFTLLIWRKALPDGQLCGVPGCSAVLQPSPALLHVGLAAEDFTRDGKTIRQLIPAQCPHICLP